MLIGTMSLVMLVLNSAVDDIYDYSCSIGNGEDIDYSNGRYDFTLTVTWNGEIITSGALSPSSNNGDHVYRFYLRFGDVIRNRHHIITGKLL